LLVHEIVAASPAGCEQFVCEEGWYCQNALPEPRGLTKVRR